MEFVNLRDFGVRYSEGTSASSLPATKEPQLLVGTEYEVRNDESGDSLSDRSDHFAFTACMAPAKSGNFVGLFRHALGCQLQIGYRFPHGFPSHSSENLETRPWRPRPFNALPPPHVALSAPAGPRLGGKHPHQPYLGMMRM